MAQGLDYSRLDGTTKAKDRVQIVKEFNSSSHLNLCLVSTMLVEEKNRNVFIVIHILCCFLPLKILFALFSILCPIICCVSCDLHQLSLHNQGRWTWSELCGSQCSGAV